MGKRNKDNNNFQGNIISKLPVKECHYCLGCPARLYTPNEFIIYGKGNVCSPIMFVIYDSYKHKQDNIKLLKDVYQELFQKDIFEEHYVTTAVKCECQNEILMQSFINCRNLLCDEITSIMPNKIIVVGNIRINFGDKYKIYYIPNIYSLLYGEKNIAKFKERLLEAIYD